MVRCEHILDAICITELDLELLKQYSYEKVDVKRLKRDVGNWSCVQCGTSKSPWLCLACGLIYCGKLINQDGQRHFHDYPKHSLCMDCYGYSVFCYGCEEFVDNIKNSKIASIRRSLQFYNNIRNADHTYSCRKYESRLDMENAVEIFTREPRILRDEETEEEEAGQGFHSNEFEFAHVSRKTEEADTVSEVELMQTADEENREASVLETNRNGQVVFNLHSSGDEQDRVETCKSLSEKVFLRNDRACKLIAVKSLNCIADKLKFEKTNSENSSNDQNRNSRKRKRKVSIVIKVKRPRGLKNLGNTCYMNSVIQALNALEIFRYFILNLPPLKLDKYVQGSISPRTTRYNTRKSLPIISDAYSSRSFLSEELRKTLKEIGIESNSSAVGSDAFGPFSLLMEVFRVDPRFKDIQQHDSHELLRRMLDHMHYELKNCQLPDGLLFEFCNDGVHIASKSDFIPDKKRETEFELEDNCVIGAMFGGKLQSQVTCLYCNTTSTKLDPFLDLSLDISSASSACRTTTVHLHDCLKQYFAKEQLDSFQEYTCDKCKKKCPTTKQLFVRLLPNILCLHLKRFRWSHLQHGKLDIMVDFPIKGLDMKDFMISQVDSADSPRTNDEQDFSLPLMDSRSNSSSSSMTVCVNDCSTIYDLSSLIVHHGAAVNSGHYTTYGHHYGQWYHFNDAIVKSCTEQLVAKQKAYLLFYVRRSRE